jgi:hypothetical protein
MRLASNLVLAALVLACSSGCISKFSRNLALKSTSNVLFSASPSLQMEADYELARSAIPASLKTVETFYIATPKPEPTAKLVRVLTEGYCQYGTGFVEDDWEAAKFRQDIEAVEYHNTRSSHIFTRCLNYALSTLGSRWQKEIFSDLETVKKLLKDTPRSQRFALLFAGMALGSLVNHNLTRIEMLSYIPTVQAILERVLEMDAQGPPRDPEGSYYEGQINQAHAALPHIALGMVHSGRAASMGGEPEKARTHFEMALKLTDNKMLLARTLMAYRVGKQTNDRKFFHDQLKIVVETAPSVWPEQRLANEVAHRKARRYLTHEKGLFQ